MVSNGQCIRDRREGSKLHSDASRALSSQERVLLPPSRLESARRTLLARLAAIGFDEEAVRPAARDLAAPQHPAAPGGLPALSRPSPSTAAHRPSGPIPSTRPSPCSSSRWPSRESRDAGLRGRALAGPSRDRARPRGRAECGLRLALSDPGARRRHRRSDLGTWAQSRHAPLRRIVGSGGPHRPQARGHRPRPVHGLGDSRPSRFEARPTRTRRGRAADGRWSSPGSMRGSTPSPTWTSARGTSSRPLADDRDFGLVTANPPYHPLVGIPAGADFAAAATRGRRSSSASCVRRPARLEAGRASPRSSRCSATAAARPSMCALERWLRESGEGEVLLLARPVTYRPEVLDSLRTTPLSPPRARAGRGSRSRAVRVRPC